MSFNAVKPYKCSRNKFNLGHNFTFTCKPGYVYPVLVQDYSVGDAFSLNFSELIKMQPLSSPAYLDAQVRFDVFRVDTGTVFDKWYDFAKQNGSEETPIVFPYIEIPEHGFSKGSLGDFLNVAVGTGEGVKMDATLFRSYQAIMDEYYINSIIQDPVGFSKAAGLDTTTSLSLRKANLRKDRFTGLSTTTQNGDEVILPIGTSAPVKSIDKAGGNPVYLYDATSDSKIDTAGTLTVNTAGIMSYTTPNTATPKNNLTVNFEADLSGVTGVGMNLFDSAQRLSLYRRLNLFAGEHYSDWQYVQYGIPSSDARLQRPEWLGSYKMPFLVSEVLQNSQTTDTSPQGTMAGHGMSAGGAHLYVPTLNNTGYIFVMMTILPRVSYDQGLPKQYTRFSPFDYIIPIFNNMPLQKVKEQELYLQDADVVDSDGNVVNEKTLGYAPIYDEYRHRNNRVAGDIHDSLSYWTVKRTFNSAPVLNSEFIQPADNIMDGVFAVSSAIADPFVVSINFGIMALRKLKRVGLPTFV